MLFVHCWTRRLACGVFAPQMLMVLSMPKPVMSQESAPAPPPWPTPEIVSPLAARFIEAVSRWPDFDPAKRKLYRKRAPAEIHGFLARNRSFFEPWLAEELVKTRCPEALWLRPDFMELAADRMTATGTERYDLDGIQRDSLRKRSRKALGEFIAKHREPLDSLLTDVLVLTIENKTPDAEWVIARAKQLEPIMEEMDQQLQAFYREMVPQFSPEQRKKWRQDFAVQRLGLTIAQARIRGWAQGRYDKREWLTQLTTPFDNQRRILSEGQKAGMQPETPQEISVTAEMRFGANPVSPKPEPPDAQPESEPDVDGGRSVPLDRWQSYTKEFISRYDLDEGQKTAAMAILRETQERAKAYRNSHVKEFDSLKTSIRTAEGPARARLHAQLNELETPIHELFEGLHIRLDALLSTSQRR